MLTVLGMCTYSYGVGYSSHRIETIQSPDDRPCLFFRLIGVTSNADPAVGTTPWFAVPLSHQAFDVISSILLIGYTTDRNMEIHTSGNEACGHAEVFSVAFDY